MKKVVLAVLMMVAFAVQANASDKWTNEDAIRQGVIIGLTLVDWNQTRTIAAHPEKYYEKQAVILGNHPSVDQVDLYMVGLLVGNYLLADYLPTPYRKWFQILVIAEKVPAVAGNFSLGIGIRVGF